MNLKHIENSFIVLSWSQRFQKFTPNRGFDNNKQESPTALLINIYKCPEGSKVCLKSKKVKVRERMTFKKLLLEILKVYESKSVYLQIIMAYVKVYRFAYAHSINCGIDQYLDKY